MKLFNGIAPRSFRQQIILTFVLGFFLLISSFAIYMTHAERNLLYSNNCKDAIGLAQALEASSRSWVLANDIVGLQEIVHALQSYSELSYDMIISPTGRVLAHTDESNTGKFIADVRSLSLLKAPSTVQIIQKNSTIADIAVPIMLGDRQLGWARVALSRAMLNSNLSTTAWRNTSFVLFFSALALLASWIISSHLNASFSTLVKVAEQVRRGNLSARANVDGNVDEVAILAAGFNQMLDALEQAEEERKNYKEHLENEVQQRTAELVLARDAADAANLAKSVFLANMSHELRTPLNAILGFSNILRHDPAIPGRQKESLAIINKSGNHLLGLINDVLEIAKIEAGCIALEPAPFDLSSMVTDVIDMLRIRAQNKGLQLLLDQSSATPRYVVGDEAKLRQILINLISNAIKATEQGGISLRIGIKNNHPEHLIIEVEDSGCGISAQDQDKLFQPFVQIGPQGTQQGTGLGLAITREFTELMNGSISVSSTVGHGSIFHVEIKVQSATAQDMPPASPSLGTVTGLEPGQPPCRVLVVEDQLDNQLLLMSLLENIGLEVKLAENGYIALEHFKQWQPHFIWMDRRMPVMDGVEATRRIRALPGGDKVKIAAITASTFKEQDAQLTAAGFDTIVHKPYRSDQIFECMERLLNLRLIREDVATIPAQHLEISSTALAALPQALRQELITALELLDRRHIQEAIQKISAIDANLASALDRRARKYDYKGLLQIVQAKES
ncbi:MAG: ATP-binding protein [Desulfuromonas sp.]|nr:ATP-binding protein [Desulfuromonas sp.]